MKFRFFLVILLLIIQKSVFADGYWLEVNGNGKINDTIQIKLRYGGVNEQQIRYIKKDHELDKLKDFKLWVITPNGEKTYLHLSQDKDAWIGYYIPKNKGTFHFYAFDDNLPVVSRKDSLNNIKPIQYLSTKYVVEIEKSEKFKPSLFLDLNVNIRNNIATIKGYIDKRQIQPGDSIRVFLPDNHDEKFIFTKEKCIKIPLIQKGTYLIRIGANQSQNGIQNNVRYYAIRHRYDYTLDYK